MRKLIFAVALLAIGCNKDNAHVVALTRQIRIEIKSDSPIVATVLIAREEKIFPIEGHYVKKYFTANVGDLITIKQYQHTPYIASVAVDNAMLLIDSATNSDIAFIVK